MWFARLMNPRGSTVAAAAQDNVEDAAAWRGPDRPLLQDPDEETAP
jgi:hypothetical protein